jgi:hypothetical protein
VFAQLFSHPWYVGEGDAQVIAIRPETGSVEALESAPRFADADHVARRLRVEHASAFEPTLAPNPGEVPANLLHVE